MRQALREVAEQFTGAGVELFREEAEIVARGRHPVEGLPRFFEPSLTGVTLREPEGAGEKRAFPPVQAVVRPAALIAQEHPAFLEFRAYRVHGADHSWVVPGDEIDRRQQQEGAIERGGTEGLRKDSALFLVAVLFHGGTNFLTRFLPAAQRRFAQALFREADS